MKSKYFNFSSSNFLILTTYNNNNLNQNTVLPIIKENQLNKKYIARAEQIHSNKICYIDHPGFYYGADGLITDVKSKLILVIKTADCIPLFIYDNINGIYGVVHAGWKGISKKIHVNAISKFFDYNSDAKNINVIMGPSIKSCCYEISDDLIKLFDNSFINIKGNRSFLDLNKCIISDFKEIGISAMDSYIYYRLKGYNSSPKGMGCLMNISGSNLCYFDTGGDFAIELENSGPNAQIDFTINELKSLFGSKIDKYFIKAHSTQWGKNLFTLGSYASAEPGSAHLRKIIKEQINDCLFFAGEATANEYASVSGAHRSGIRAANEVMSS